MAKKEKLPLKTVERILREAGAKRVSKSATQAFAKYLEQLTAHIAEEAGNLAEHSGRKTIKEKDIKLAKKRVK
ncbi:MAG: NFYB/HAP3 family transcription factor subunit [Candidatus Aenigmarchaeota archaeon]|nr:NFYB/HAP3 family transcription factor subunit [Candidatus Aenigmarchaeota archaeon]